MVVFPCVPEIEITTLSFKMFSYNHCGPEIKFNFFSSINLTSSFSLLREFPIMNISGFKLTCFFDHPFITSILFFFNKFDMGG